MSAVTTTVEAPSLAAFVHALAALDHELRAVVVATEGGVPWAQVEVSPMTNTYRAVFPLRRDGFRGDTRKRGQAGVMATARDGFSSLPVVVERARRLWAQS